MKFLRFLKKNIYYLLFIIIFKFVKKKEASPIDWISF